MIYTKLTCKAMDIAYNAHQGQFDKSGIPYIFHPYHLAEQMTDEFTVCAALLHDVVEDTDVTIEDLEKEFPSEVTEAVKLLTHADNVDYFDYIRAVKRNRVAKTVKLADLHHNSDISRITDIKKRISDKTMERMQKYAEAEKILTEAD